MKGSEFLSKVEQAEKTFHSLVKFDDSLLTALAHLDQAAKAGHIDPKHVDAIRKEVATDKLVRTVGNFAAYNAFARQTRPGVHIRLDANDFGGINKLHGFETGNQAIQSLGNSVRESVDQAVGRKNGKVFRIGGDEFHIHVPSQEHAARFARTLRQKLAALPPVGGTHNLSVSLGFGHNIDSAERALIHAKTAKKAANYPQGQAQTHVHSLVPGFEGAVPVNDMTPKTPAQPAV